MCSGPRCLCMPSASVDMPLGRNSSIYDYKTACNASVQATKRIRSTDKPKVAKPHICPGQRAGQARQRQYLQLAVNRQPGYRWENSQSKALTNK